MVISTAKHKGITYQVAAKEGGGYWLHTTNEKGLAVRPSEPFSGLCEAI